MLGTDKAWDVQDKLEEFYFARKAEEAQSKPLRTQVLAIDYVDRITASLPRLGEAAMQQLYSEASEIDLGRRLIPLPVIKEKHYTATEIADLPVRQAGELGVAV